MNRDGTIAIRELSVSRATLIACVGTVLTVALHVTFSGLYGYQRDELYFIACAKHLAWGYVDQPPLIALVTDVAMRLFGDTLVALRLLPALAAGALVALGTRFAARLGGGPYAQVLVAVALALAPFDLAIGNLLTMNAFEPLFWLGLTLLVYEQLESPRGWRSAAIGVVVGVGILNKWSMGVYACALGAGIILSPVRRDVFVRSTLVSIGLAALIAAPNISWQAAHGWPQLEVLRNADIAKNFHVSPPMFALEQLPLMNPFVAPLWIAGLVSFLRSKRHAGIAIGYFVLLAFELICHGKVYYVAPVYPMLIVAGAVAFEHWTRRIRGLRLGLAGAIAVSGFAIMPLAMPSMPLLALVHYQRTLDVRGLKMENHPTGLVPQQFADQLGWNELETTIARVVGTLSPAERASTAILTGDYGQAAALDFFGRRDGLPVAISGHNQYYLWGPHGDHRVIVAVGVPRRLLAREYASIERVATYESPFVLPENNNLPVYVCREPRIPLERFWPQLRRYV